MAVVVALLLLGGVTQAAGFHGEASTCAVELDDAPIDFGDLAVPVELVRIVTAVQQTITIVMPSLDQPISSAFAPRTFRPPRG
jgi:hypothetical protein